MKKNAWKTILIFLLTAALAAGVVGCGKDTQTSTKVPKDVPDYSNSTKELHIYAHRSTSEGSFTGVNGELIKYDSYITKEKFQEFKDCGFDVIYPQENAYNGEDFETSRMKAYLDLAQEVGLKCIVADDRIKRLSGLTTPLVGEGGEFATMEDLANQLREYLEPYADHPAFYGIVTRDEPKWDALTATCQVRQALKMVDENLYVKTTLMPYHVTIKSDIPSNTANMFYTNVKVKFGLEAQRNGDSGELIIDANNVSTNQSVVQIAHTGGEFYLGEYVTIKNAKNPNGGALRNKGTAILEGNMTNNVTSRTGGAIYNEGTLTINKGTILSHQNMTQICFKSFQVFM